MYHVVHHIRDVAIFKQEGPNYKKKMDAVGSSSTCACSYETDSLKVNPEYTFRRLL